MMQAYGKAIQDGLEQTIQVLPAIARQQITAKAKGRLNSSLEEYLAAINTSYQDYVFVMELDKDSWLANAVEIGVDGFDMTRGFFNSPKAKMSKEGFKYLHIPIDVDKNKSADSANTAKAQEYQRLIQQVLRKPKFNNSSVSAKADGSVIEIQKLETDVPEMQGMYRSRKFRTADDFHSKKRGSNFQYMLLRTVSEKGSKTGARFQHPGIEPANLFKQLERDLPELFETMLDDNIRENLKGIF